MIIVLIAPSDRLMDLPVTLTSKDLARVLDRSVSWIEKQVRAGTLGIPRIEGAPGLLWARESVQLFLAKRTEAPPKVVELQREHEAAVRARRRR